MRLRTPEHYTYSETITSNTIFIEMLPCFQVNFSMKLLKKMLRPKWNSIPDWTKKRRDIAQSTKQQPVTLQYRFYFQKFSDFLRAGTQNVHLMVLYYG